MSASNIALSSTEDRTLNDRKQLANPFERCTSRSSSIIYEGNQQCSSTGDLTVDDRKKLPNPFEVQSNELNEANDDDDYSTRFDTEDRSDCTNRNETNNLHDILSTQNLVISYSILLHFYFKLQMCHRIPLLLPLGSYVALSPKDALFLSGSKGCTRCGCVCQMD